MPLTYWERRAVQRVLDAQTRENNAMRAIAQAVQRALAEIQDSIERIGRNFEKAFDLTPEESGQMLAAPADRSEYERLLGEIAQMPEGAARTQLQARVASGGYAYRISREEALRAHVEAQAAILGARVEKQTKETLDAVGTETATGVQQDAVKAGLAIDFTGDSLAAVREISSTPWNGDNYSSRIWTNTRALQKLLDDTVMSGFLTGRSSRKIAEDVAEKMNVAYYQAERLVRTEVNRLQNAVALEEMRKAGVAEYVWVAALDKRTCEHCGGMDGKHYPLAAAVIGKTLPPLHPFDRCIITMYVAAQEGQTRFARDAQDNGIKVSASTTYEQWAAQQGSQFTVQQKMQRNLSADQAQYDAYRKLLGENVFTADFKSFQQAKYNNAQAYEMLKLDYKRRNALAADPLIALPNAEVATAASEKFTRYLFNPENADGWAKGVAFDSRLGYNVNNWEELRDAILKGAVSNPSTLKGENQQGNRYEQRMILYGIKGTPANVLVGWLADKDGTHMTTTYIKEVKPGEKTN